MGTKSSYAANVVISFFALFAVVGCSRGPSEPVGIAGPTILPVQWGEPASATISTDESSVVRIAVAQRDIDVSLRVTSGSDAATQTDSPLRRHATDYLTLRTSGPEVLTIELASVEEDYVQGSVRLVVDTLPELSAADRRLVAAELALTATEDTTAGEPDWESRASEYERIAGIFEDIGLESRAADAFLRAAAANYSHLYRWQQSARLSRTAETLFARSGDSRMSALAQALRGAALIETISEDPNRRSAGNNAGDQVKTLLESALNTLQASGDTYNAARVTNDIGLLNYYLGNYDVSRDYYERANELFTSLSETRWQTITLQNLLLQDFELRRDVANAPARYEQLLQLIDEENDQRLYVDVLNNAALANTLMGNLTSAISQYERALALWRDHAERGRIYAGLALATSRGGDFERARAFLETAVPLLDDANDHRGLASAELLLGNIYRSADEIDKAIQHHQTSVAAYKSAYRKARVRIELAKDFLAARDYSAAEEQIDRLNEDNSVDSPDVDAGVYLLRAALAISADDHVLARSLAQDSIALAERFGLRDRLLDAQMLIAESYEAQGDRQKMREALQSAIAIVDDIRSRIGSPQLRATLIAERSDPYDRLIASYFDELAEGTQPANGATDELLELALQAMERSRSRVFREQLLAASDGGAYTGALLAEIAKHERLIYEHSTGRASNTDLLESTEEIAQLASSLLTASTIGSGPAQRGLSVSEIQERLQVGDVLLSYWTSDSAPKLIALRKDSLRLGKLPDTGDVGQDVTDFLSSISNPSTRMANVDGATARLRSLLLPEGTIVDEDKRVYVQADGALHAVPFQLLAGNEKPVARVVSLFPMGQADRGQRDVSLVFANSEGANAGHSGLGATRSPASTQTALPYVGVEVDALRSYLDGNRTAFYLEGEATRASLLRPSGTAFDTIHIAAHALANPIMPELSWIQLADGKVFSGEIEKAVLPARLVVLSACESGLGRNIEREGVFGLTRSFLVAGADGVVASLWQVSDRSTAELFRNFYRISQASNESVAESLLKAQNQVREKPVWRHPYYWSGFEVWLRSPFDARN